MKKLFLITAILLLSNLCFSHGNAKVKKEHKHLSYTEYMSKYGTDEVSLALIDLYFEKRETAGKGKMSILPVTTIVAVAFPPLGVPMAIIATPIFISGLITCSRYSNKKLTKVLIAYRTTNKIPKRLMRKVTSVINMQQLLLSEK